MWTKIFRALERKMPGRRRKTAAPKVPSDRTKGLFQIRREAAVWICSPVIYGSGTTFLPLSLSTRRLVDLFTLCRLPHASLTEDCFIVEFFDDIKVAQLQEFGFVCAELAAV
jgi:hypothetical protein